DSEFPFYKLHCARQAIRSGNRDAYPIAGCLLAELVGNSMLFLQAFEWLEHLRDHGLYCHPRFDELAQKVQLAKKRIFVAGYGVEDWDAIPLRSPMAPGPDSPLPRPSHPLEVTEKSAVRTTSGGDGTCYPQRAAFGAGDVGNGAPRTARPTSV